MPHIHTEPGQVDVIVNAYIFRRTSEGAKVLLHRHLKLDILLPCGGHIELNETPWGAIAHELAEEMGYTLAELDVLQPKLRVRKMEGAVIHPQPVLMNTHRVPTPVEHYHTEVGYLFVAHEEPQRTPDEGESQDLTWFTRDEILDLPKEAIWEQVRQTLITLFDEFLDKWEPLPATSYTVSKE